MRIDGSHIFFRMSILERVGWLGFRRVHVALLVHVGLVANFMLRVNINIAIEYMTK